VRAGVLVAAGGAGTASAGATGGVASEPAPDCGAVYSTDFTWLIGIVRVMLSPPASVISLSLLLTTRPLICEPSFSHTVAGRRSADWRLQETIVIVAARITAAVCALNLIATFPFLLRRLARREQTLSITA
jgi:hypothetical protein